MAVPARLALTPASATVTSFTVASRPGNTPTSNWSVPPQAVLAANAAAAIARVDVETGRSGRGAQAAAQPRSPEPDRSPGAQHLGLIHHLERH